MACRTLADDAGVQRTDIALDRVRTVDDGMRTIRQAKEIARKWDLKMYVRFRAGSLQLTFVRRTPSLDATPNTRVDERELA